MLRSRYQDSHQTARREVRDRPSQEAGVDRVRQRRGVSHRHAEEVRKGGQVQRHQVKEHVLHVEQEVNSAGANIQVLCLIKKRLMDPKWPPPQSHTYIIHLLGADLLL